CYERQTNRHPIMNFLLNLTPDPSLRSRMTTQPCVILGAAKNLACHKLLEPMPAHKNEQFVSENPREGDA
ncbi:MAG TPA: hypothetical protein VHV54_20035, partial [Candidatus Binatia bacterium]|nr:hypothetical protein [Candidatus Binatia bacterium]